MAIVVTLYNCSDNNKTVHKTLSNGTSYSNCIFKDSAELHQPIFTVSETLSADFNYCSISGIDNRTRYYFAEVINLRTNLSVVRCDLDVLMTYDLSGVPVVPARSSSNQNAWLIDTRRPVETTVQHYNVLFNGDNLDYNNMTLIAGIVGTGGTPTNN